MERIAKLPKKALIPRNGIVAFIVCNLFISAQFFAQKGVESPKLKTVVIDAGHGGKDPGCHGGYAHEKEVCLSMALKLGKLIKEKYPSITVKYTRETDFFVELIERANIANRANADLFICIHANAGSTVAYGTETYVLGLHRTESQQKVMERENSIISLEDDKGAKYKSFDLTPDAMIAIQLQQNVNLNNAIKFAGFLQSEFKTIGRYDRGVKQAGFWVLHNTYMPSILIETGFITNKSEGDYLNSQKGKISISKSISDAILNYKSKLNSDPLLETKALPNKLVEETEQKNKNISVAEIQPNSSKLIFKVQISAGPNRLSTKSYNFNGLSQISRQKLDSIYRYFYGNTSKYSIALELLKKAISKGYKTAYIVAYSDGEMITINEALKSATN